MTDTDTETHAQTHKTNTNTNKKQTHTDCILATGLRHTPAAAAPPQVMHATGMMYICLRNPPVTRPRVQHNLWVRAAVDLTAKLAWAPVSNPTHTLQGTHVHPAQNLRALLHARTHLSLYLSLSLCLLQSCNSNERFSAYHI